LSFWLRVFSFHDTRRSSSAIIFWHHRRCRCADAMLSFSPANRKMPPPPVDAHTVAIYLMPINAAVQMRTMPAPPLYYRQMPPARFCLFEPFTATAEI